MSDDVEEITKTPAVENVKTKEKDPKKVAAGKKLAEYNKRVKEALKEKMKREAEKSQEEEEREMGERHSNALEVGWIPEISFTTAISLVGIGLTALNMFMSYKKDTEEIAPPRLPEPEEIPVPKMGMH